MEKKTLIFLVLFFTFWNEKWLLQQCERVLGNSKKCASKSNCQVQHKIVLMRRNALLHIEIIVSELQFHFTQFGIRISNWLIAKLQNQCDCTLFIHLLSSGNEAISLKVLVVLGMVADMVISASGFNGVLSSADCGWVSSMISDGNAWKIPYIENFCRHL